MMKTLALAIAIAAVAAVSVPAQAKLSANSKSLNGTSLKGITSGAALNGQITGIEFWAGTGEDE